MFGLEPETQIAAIEAAERAIAEQEMDNVETGRKMDQLAEELRTAESQSTDGEDQQAMGAVDKDSLKLSVEATGAIIAVIEYRKMRGMGPMLLPNGSQAPDGGLSVTADAAKKTFMAEAEAKTEARAEFGAADVEVGTADQQQPVEAVVQGNPEAKWRSCEILAKPRSRSRSPLGSNGGSNCSSVARPIYNGAFESGSNYALTPVRAQNHSPRCNCA